MKSGHQGIRLNEAAYDKVAQRYDASRKQWDEQDLLLQFADRVLPGGQVLDAGCGAGVPVARFLKQRGFSVTGVDISSAMLELARSQVPDTIFMKGDLTKLEFRDQSFDGLVSCYAVIHVPRIHHAKIFIDFARILRPGAPLLVSLGSSEWEGTENFCGANMYWSHYAPEKSLSLLTASGFRICRSEARGTKGEVHFWVLAERN